jgi:hypothetical protein
LVVGNTYGNFRECAYIWVHKINYRRMEALLFVLVLFVLAIASPWLFPNKMVSDNKYDKEA